MKFVKIGLTNFKMFLMKVVFADKNHPRGWFLFNNLVVQFSSSFM